MMTVIFRAILIFVSLWEVSWGFRTRIPVGMLVDPSDPVSATIVRHTLYQQDRESSWPKQYVVEVIPENMDPNDASQIDRAVCRLMKQGVMAVIAPTSPLSYQMLVTYSNDFELPLISPAFPDVPMDIRPMYTFSAQPSVTRAVVDLLRYYKWQDFVYLYDADDGPDALQKILQLGYRALRFSLTGILRISHPEEANRYLRKLDSVKKYHTFNVILDMEHSLARDIIIRHAHDVHVGKTNFHFLIKRPTMEEFWVDNAPEFGVVNVTGFSVLKPEKVKNFRDAWKALPQDIWPGAGTSNLNMSAYFYRDASVVLGEALKKLLKRMVVPHTIDDADAHKEVRDCMQEPPLPLPYGKVLSDYMKQSIVADGLSGRIIFDATNGQRKYFELMVMNSSHTGNQVMGIWTDNRGLQPAHMYPEVFQNNDPKAFPRIDEKKKYKVASVLGAPFMMIKENQVNASDFRSNDAYEGFCKDLLELLSKELKFDYELQIMEDGEYGRYDEKIGAWTGAIGGLIRGKSDMVMADLHVNGRRQRVVEFTDPFAAVTLSILMKSPQRVSSGSWTFFFLSAFSKETWACIVVSAVVVTALFYALSKFTGSSPDNIEAANRVWGKKFSVVRCTWFTTGSALMQGTGLYPRFTSSRILGGTWWCFTLIMLALYIASLTTQVYMNNTDKNGDIRLSRLTSLSLESILREAIWNDWPKVGVNRNGNTRKFIGESTIPAYKEYDEYLRENPDVATDSIQEGVSRVGQSDGDYAFLMESLMSDYQSGLEPCDVVSLHDTVVFTTYAIALPLWSPMKFEINEGLRVLSQRGELGELHRKWFIESSRCRNNTPKTKNNNPVSMESTLGLFLVTLFGFVLVALVGCVQYYLRKKMREERRVRLSFEEVAMGNTLPMPPPELLMEPPPDDDSGLIDGWAERKLVPSSFVGEDDGDRQLSAVRRDDK